MTRRDLDNLALRIERLMRVRMADLDPSDEQTFRQHMPEGHPGRQRVLPTPQALREMDPKDAAPHFRSWVAWVGDCEHALHRNREPQRTIRDLQRGRVSARTLPFLVGRRR